MQIEFNPGKIQVWADYEKAHGLHIMLNQLNCNHTYEKDEMEVYLCIAWLTPQQFTLLNLGLHSNAYSWETWKTYVNRINSTLVGGHKLSRNKLDSFLAS
jgi:hypothetical protein|tara:strand:+ start:633 stop:932 length:300 start_codon:yes stop_codon:yes gene_type:complete